MVIAFLSALLLLALVGLIVISLNISKLQAVIEDHENQSEEQEKEYAKKVKDLSGQMALLDASNKRLQKWSLVADADEKAESLLQNAQNVLEKAQANSRRINQEADQDSLKLLRAAELKTSTAITEARKKAEEILQNAQVALSEAEATIRKMRQDAEQKTFELLKTAEIEASSTTAEARKKAKELREEAQAVLNTATLNAAKVGELAMKRAEEIAGSAYEALKNTDQLEKTAKAMKNIIEGYGDEYLIPSYSLLDELAEEFTHTQSGRELKAARDHIKLMVNNGTAVKCEYAESGRRKTAERFVLFAFNGKVDAVLARVKHDNFGKLSQEIQDDFILINREGKAFRDARVTDEYLDARLNELKLATITHQLKQEQQEEQRRIREQIREEEKARQDYERALRESAKSEKAIRDAIERMQEQSIRATELERNEFKKQLEELNLKLQEAEERGIRAVSMAQQTKRGHVYIISNIGSFGERVYKIGLTRRLDPLDRIRELGDASVPFEFDVHGMVFSEDAPALENKLHKHFLMSQMNKVNYRKEFFKIDLNEICDEFNKLGLEVQWTMKALAADYHETMAIERLIRNDPVARQAWLNRQLQLDPTNVEVSVEESN